MGKDLKEYITPGMLPAGYKNSLKELLGKNALCFDYDSLEDDYDHEARKQMNPDLSDIQEYRNLKIRVGKRYKEIRDSLSEPAWKIMRNSLVSLDHSNR